MISGVGLLYNQTSIDSIVTNKLWVWIKKINFYSWLLIKRNLNNTTLHQNVYRFWRYNMIYFRGRKSCMRKDPTITGECTDDFISISGVSKFVLNKGKK